MPRGGEGGIRTLDGLLTHTPLAGARLRPLGHLSGQEIALITERRMIPARSSPGKAKGRCYPRVVAVLPIGGEGGIDSGLRPSPSGRRVRVVQNRLRRFCRTLDGLLTHTPLAGARLRPLGHLCGQEIALIAGRGMIPARSSPGKAKGSNRLDQALSNVIDNLGDRSSR